MIPVDELRPFYKHSIDVRFRTPISIILFFDTLIRPLIAGADRGFQTGGRQDILGTKKSK